MDGQSSDTPMNMQRDRRPSAAPALMVQKKGEREIYYIPVNKINCWADLVTALHRLFTFSFSSPPDIVTFDGHVVNEKTYLDFVKPGTHLFLNFPIDFQASENVLRRMNDHLSPGLSNANAYYSIAFMKKDPTGGTTAVQSFAPYSPSPNFRNELEATEARERRHEEQRQASYVQAREERIRFSQYSAGSGAPSERRQFTNLNTPAMSTLSPHSSGTPLVGRRLSQSSETPSSVSQSTSYLSDDSYRKMSHSLTPATEVDYNASESGWGFNRSPNVWYAAADPWTTVDGKNEQKRLGLPEFPSKQGTMLEEAILDTYEPSSFSVAPYSQQQIPQSYPAPVLPSFSTDDMQLGPGFPIPNIIEQSLNKVDPSAVEKTSGEQAEDETSSIRSQSPLNAQWDRIETPESSTVLLCPHITFHCTKPIDLKIRVTPTVTVIPPSNPLEHDRMFATAIGEHVNLQMSIEGNGKITRIISEPEGTKSPEKITLLKKSQAKGAGGRWYISRMETQLEGGWGSAEVGDVGGLGNDGKKRNPGIMVDWSFKGEANERRTFGIAYDKLSEFLDVFMETCGFPKRERQTMINFWARRLPQEASENEFLLVKMLPVKDLITLLPIQTDPPPDRVVRFFIIIRRATREIIQQEGLNIRGEMKRVVYEVLGSKPRPEVPATRKKRGRGKARPKGPQGDSNAAMREAERPAGPDPNPRVLVEGGSGLTIFEYGGVLMANHEMEGPPEKALLATTSESIPSAMPVAEHTPAHTPGAASVGSAPGDVDNGVDMDMTTPNESLQADYFMPHMAPKMPMMPVTQAELQMSQFAATQPDDMISNLYYDSNQSLQDPFGIYAHQDMELHDPNQQYFSIIGPQTGYGTGFFGGLPVQAQPTAWGWPDPTTF